MTSTNAEIERVVLVRLDPGDDVLKSLQKAVDENGITSGLILNGLGSTSSYHYHVVADTNLPPKEAFPRGNGPNDVVSFSGLVMDGRVHAHILFTDVEKAHGGHLEEGTTVLTFNVVAIADLGDADVRNWDKVGDLAR